MDKNVLPEMSKLMSIYSEDMSGLNRAEKLSIRNQIVLALVGAGASYNEITKTFNISERQARRIIDDAHASALDWYKDLPKKIRISAFKINVNEVFNELMKLKQIRNETKALPLKFEMTEKIANLQIKYDRMLSEGPTLDRIREQGEILEQLIEQYQKKGTAQTSSENTESTSS